MSANSGCGECPGRDLSSKPVVFITYSDGTHQPLHQSVWSRVEGAESQGPGNLSGSADTLNAFLTECELIFELQPSRFVDDRTKVSYMISLLRGTPLLAERPLLSQIPRPIILEDFTLFVDYLRTNYGDPDEKGTARRKLKALRQVGPASSYFAEFQQYIAIPGWKDQDPIVDRAIDGLKPYLKDEVARTGLQPRSLSDLISFIVPLDNRLYEREQERRRDKRDQLKGNEAYYVIRYDYGYRIYSTYAGCRPIQPHSSCRVASDCHSTRVCLLKRDNDDATSTYAI